MLLAVFLTLAFLVSTYGFGDALYNGIRQARFDVKRKRELAAYAQYADEAVREAKRRLTGRDLL